jgi:hypothetical protein
MQQPFPLQVPVDPTQGAGVAHELGGLLHGSQAMLVHGVFVILVELQQAASMGESRNDFFEHTHFVQRAQHFAQSGWLRQ